MKRHNFSFSRAPSEELRKLFYPGRILSTCLDVINNTRIEGLQLDVHFRRLDCIHVYCGLTRVLVIKKLKRNNHIKLTADKFYQEQACGQRFLRNWHENDDGFLRELKAYLEQVRVHSQHTDKEGAVQLMWSRIINPWIPFDREIRLEYQSIPQREKCRVFEGVQSAFLELMENVKLSQQPNAGLPWAEPKRTGLKLDQIAISPDGRLTLVELKHAKGSASEIYYSPFQLLQYVWEWHKGLRESQILLKQVQDLLDARTDIGLTTQPNTRLNDNIRAAVCFGTDDRNDVVKSRYRTVLDIVNRNLPSSATPIETWEYSDGGPQRIH